MKQCSISSIIFINHNTTIDKKIQIDIKEYKSEDTKKLVRHLVKTTGTMLDFPIIGEDREDRNKQANLLLDNTQDSDCLNAISPCKLPPSKKFECSQFFR